MLNRDGIIIRYIFAFCFFFLSGTGILTGWLAGYCGIAGTIELVTALVRWSPLVEALNYLTARYLWGPASAKTE